MKRTINRLLVRFALLCVAIILGAIAVAQAQRGMGTAKKADLTSVAEILPANQVPIQVPFQDKTASWAAAEPKSNSEQPTQPEYREPAYAQQIPTEPNSNERPYAEPRYGHQDEILPTADFSPVPPPYRQANASAAELEDGQLAQPAFDQLETDQPEFAQPEFDQQEIDRPEFGQAEFGQAEFAQPEFDQPELAEPDYRQPEFAPSELNGGAAYAVEETYRPPMAGAPPIDPQVANNHVDNNRVAHTQVARPRVPETQFAEQYVPPAVNSPNPPATAIHQSVSEAEFANELPVQETATYDAPTRFVNDQATLRPLQKDSAASAGLIGIGKPGTSDLEGPQKPNLSVTKTAPAEIQVGKSAEFRVTVRNVGSTTAHDVTIRDEIPAGTEMVDTTPAASHSEEGELIWQIGELPPGEEHTVSMHVIPQQEGEIGSVAQVYFAALASAKAICTRPQISLEHVGPRQVLVGEDVIFKIKLHNPGTGIANNVVIEEDVPPGLRHSAGKELEYPVGSLRPGETRLLELTLKADKPGIVDNVIVARADANLETEHSFQFEVIAPLLQIAIQGPRRRFLERDATFDIAIQNPGTASAKNVDLVAHLPRGMQFKSADHQGEYNSQNHTVHWTLAELPANEMGTVRLTAVPSDMGDQKIRIEGQAAMNLSDSAEHIVTVEGLAALLYTVKDLSDPVEVGGSTTYEVRVVNQGSKAATNLVLAAQAPAGMQPTSGEGPTRGVVNGQRIIFDPLARLAPQGETSYRVNVKASQAGDMRLKFHLLSDEIQTPVTKEESTHVYSDE